MIFVNLDRILDGVLWFIIIFGRQKNLMLCIWSLMTPINTLNMLNSSAILLRQVASKVVKAPFSHIESRVNNISTLVLETLQVKIYDKLDNMFWSLLCPFL